MTVEDHWKILNSKFEEIFQEFKELVKDDTDDFLNQYPTNQQ